MRINPVLTWWLKRFFGMAVIALLLVIIFVLIKSGFYFAQYFQSRGLVMEINGPEEASIGVPFELAVDFRNQSQNVFRNARLSLNLPEGTVILGKDAESRIYSEDLGDIGIGSFSRKSYDVVALKDEGFVKRFTAAIVFGSADVGQANFEERQDFDLRIKEPGVFLDLTAPDQILSGENFELKISYRNVSEKDFSGAELALVYPPNFVFASANPKPSRGNNVWELPNLPAGFEGEIKVNGHLLGASGSNFNFTAELNRSFAGRSYAVNRKSRDLAINSSPLELSLILNEQENYVVKPGDWLNYSLIYSNNSGVALADLAIKARLIGEMFDFSTLQAKANFNSLANTLTWNVVNRPELKMISAGAKGAVAFQIQAKNEFPIQRLGDKNFNLKVEVEIESPTVPYYLSVGKTTGLAKLENKVAGQTRIESRVYFRDAAAGILNQGNWPPKVNQSTQYTVHWSVANYATDVRNVEVRAFLEPGVVWTGQVKGNNDILPVYNAASKEVVWLINKIAATKGVISQPLEAVFQIEATPDAFQKGNLQPLLGETGITAFDEFTETRLQSSDAALTTALSDDLTVKPEEGIVIE